MIKFVIVSGLGLLGCAEGAADRSGWTATRDTVGDTVVVRTVEGSVWGGSARLVEELRIGRLEGPEELTFGRIVGLAVGPDGSIYVVDQQVPALRKYAPDGSYVGLFGGEGKGPGEYARPDGGLAVLRDGGIAVRDPGNGRIQLYRPDGTPAGSWRVRGSQYTSRPLYVDTAGRVYHMVFDIGEQGTRRRLAVFDATAGSEEAVDTLAIPEWEVETLVLEAVHESESGSRSMSRRSVPFAPREVWTFHPHGWFVGGATGEYSIDLLREAAPVLRIERERTPVEVLPDERENRRERTVAVMRMTDPDWRWDGPPIPETKPAWQRILAADDGRLWVRLHTEAERIPEEEIVEPDFGGANALPPERWREPAVFDVFEPDGRYLGRVEAPAEMGLYPRPVIRGDGGAGRARGGVRGALPGGAAGSRGGERLR